jgi:hypothetical protein
LLPLLRQQAPVVLLCVSASLRQAAVNCLLLLLLLKVCLLADQLLAAPDLTLPAALYQALGAQLQQPQHQPVPPLQQQLLPLLLLCRLAAAAAVVRVHLLCFAGLCVAAGLDPPAAAAAVVDYRVLNE